ncbi:kinesin-like protein subito [Bradysia coprophila]|uniref:kinesin-like protein subito n=1 Tax=Bradysia coprophila TaxID=38358 RepID=UPI00187D8D79|nr:kinesin-like protein subito [Bradysia coprophila]
MEKRSFLIGREYSIDPLNRPHPTERRNLYPLDEGEEKYSSTESVASSNASNDTASVFLRVRPSQYDSHYMVEDNVFKILNSNRSVEKQFTFSDVYRADVKQRDVYSSSVESAVDSDENLTLLMYGTSGSGKTFTLIGDADNPGVIPRAIEHIFTRYGGSISTLPKFKPVGGDYRVLSDDEIDVELIRRQVYFKLNNGSIFSGDREKIQSEHQFVRLKPSNTSVYIWISFFEIYNETLNDLLDIPATNGGTRKRDHLKMMCNSGKTFIKDLTSVFVGNSDEATQLLTLGLNYRLNAATNINHSSSRSHCLFLIDVIKREQTNIYYNRFRFCDLAGSERVKKSETSGSRLKEAQNINTSLLVLGRCLDIAFANQGKKKIEIVPCRDSKLTLFLQSALKGLEKLTMIVNIWPVPTYYDENLNVLNYASMAQNIVYRQTVPVPRHSVSRRYSFFLGVQPKEDSNLSIILDENYRLKEINEELADENDRLVSMVDELEERNEELMKTNETIEREVRKEMTENMMKELKRKAQSVEATLQGRINFLTKRHADDIAELQQKIAKLQRTIDEQDDDNNRLYDELRKFKKEAGVEDASDESINGHNDSDTITID